MGNKLEQLGMETAGEAANSLIGAGMGLLLEKHNDKRQLKQQEKLQNLNIRGQQEMGLWNQQRQMEMWKATGPVGQMEQLEQAGLNPGLIYGMGGAGGQSANIEGANIGGGNAPSGGGEAMGLMMTKMQLGLMEAQRANIEADTKGKLTAIPKIEAETESITQGVINQRTANALMEAQTAATKINAENVQTQTKLIEDQIMIMDNDVEISNATKEDKIKQIKAQAIGSLIQNEATQQGIEVNKTQITKLLADIEQGWKALDIKAKEQAIQQLFLQTQIGYAGVDRIIKGVDVVTGILPHRTISKHIKDVKFKME